MNDEQYHYMDRTQPKTRNTGRLYRFLACARLGDLELAATVKGKKNCAKLNCIVVPGSRRLSKPLKN